MNSRCITFLQNPPGQHQTQKETIFNFTRIKREKIFLIIDETGDKKKGKEDYVNRQYLGKLENRQRNCRSNSLFNRWDYVSLIFEVTSQRLGY